MRIICKKTNTVVIVSGFNQYKLEAEHPLLTAPYDTIMNIALNWKNDKLSEAELRVLFISVLNTTELLEFRTAAEPSNSLVLQYMESVIILANWKHAIGDKIPLPKIAINHATKHMEDIKSWIDAWNNAKREFSMSSSTMLIRAAMAKSEERLLKLIRNSNSSDDYTTQLASWVMQAGSVPKGLQEYWTKLFKLKGLAIYEASAADLEELLQHMIDNIPMNSTYAFTAHAHIKLLRDKAKGGILNALTSAPYEIVHDDIETYNIDIAISTSEDNIPEEKNYPTRFAYLQARAKYQLKLSKANKEETYTANQLDLITTAVKNEDNL